MTRYLCIISHMCMWTSLKESSKVNDCHHLSLLYAHIWTEVTFILSNYTWWVNLHTETFNKYAYELQCNNIESAVKEDETTQKLSTQTSHIVDKDILFNPNYLVYLYTFVEKTRKLHQLQKTKCKRKTTSTFIFNV